MKRLEKFFLNNDASILGRKDGILNIYTTAGYPKLDSTVEIVTELAKNGVDVIEIGMPYSDPLADGETIQAASQVAIANGITLNKIFEQVEEIRKSVEVPILLMGYYNQILQYGESRFFKKAKQVGVDGFIIPDLPVDIYVREYKGELEELQLDMILLITPQTSNERIKYIDEHTSGFLYMVSSYALTGAQSQINNKQVEYFERIKALNLATPKLIGFGISTKESFNKACKYAEGAIIGSAFIKSISNSSNLKKDIKAFITGIIS